MQEHIKARLARPERTPEQARVEAIVKQIRGAAQQIMTEMELGGEVIFHPTIGTPEQRRYEAAHRARRIMGLARLLDPGHPAPLQPAQNLKWVEPNLRGCPPALPERAAQ